MNPVWPDLAFLALPRRLWMASVVWALVGLTGAATVTAAEYSDAEAKFNSGAYREAEQIAQAEVERGVWNEHWSRLLIRCQLTRGAYAEALATYEQALVRFSSSLSLRLLGREVMRMNGLHERAKQESILILQTLQRSPSRYLSRDNMVAAGRYFADRGEDARQVLELFYDRVRNVDAEFVDAYIATAELALQKGDFRVASETLATAARLAPADPSIAHLSALAWQSTDRGRAQAELTRALDLNPHHVPSLLLKIDYAIDSEQYDQARKTVTQVLEINPHAWQAWCYLAVLAHLNGEFEIERLMRAAALSTWGENPGVDHLIGRKLSDKYRFAEGAEYQRQSLTFDPNFHLASFQLAQDLLRLGFDDVGWELASRVSADDPYNVVAHNLVTLHDRLREFSVLSVDDIYVRMEPREAATYGHEVLDLLAEAKRVLFEKYEVEPGQPIYVEIFPEQKDFAIRTFGLPGGDGFLGVCFGRVVTANSPASQGARPANWKSVLWHEFCHVVTLEKTRNRMPRWLSEGISVYEERQRDVTWGEQMTPRYREMILGEELTPVSQLSGAFLSPESPLHLQFAYYESSLVIEFLVQKHGIEALREILDDLGAGMPVNAAFERAVGPMDRLDAEFAEFARRHALAFGARADWTTRPPDDASFEELLGWSRVYPQSYHTLQSLAKAQLRSEQYEQARATLERLVELGVTSDQRDGVLEQLARVHRELGDTDAEERTLREIIEWSSDALPALERLIEIDRSREEWASVAQLGQRVLAIDPLRSLGHEALADAGESLDEPQWVARGMQSLLQLDPIDEAGAHYRCAAALAQLQRDEEAKHHLLRALAEAPRYRAAHRLLYQLSHAQQTVSPSPPTPNPKPPQAAEAEAVDLPSAPEPSS